jgi:hypothetical protein
MSLIDTIKSWFSGSGSSDDHSHGHDHPHGDDLAEDDAVAATAMAGMPPGPAAGMPPEPSAAAAPPPPTADDVADEAPSDEE